MYSTWLTHTRGRKDDPKTYRTRGMGPPSLKEIAMRSVLWNIDSFDASTIENLEEHFGAIIFDRLKKTNTISLRSWLLLKARYPKVVPNSYQLMIPAEMGHYPAQIDAITKCLGTISFDCLTFLSIRNVVIDTNVLFKTMEIPSLDTLILEQARFEAEDAHQPETESYVHVDDYVVRKWCEAVSEKGHFPRLRVLALRHLGATVKALDHLRLFPSLVLCNIISKGMSMCRNAQMELSENCPWAAYHSEDFMDRALLDPELVISSTDKDMNHKMSLLRTVASSFLDGPKSRILGQGLPTLSMDYGAHTASIRSRNSWFVRNMATEESIKSKLDEQAGAGRKRQGPPRQSPKKKRQMRNDKTKDVGSMLGNFFGN